MCFRNAVQKQQGRTFATIHDIDRCPGCLDLLVLETFEKLAAGTLRLCQRGR